MLNSFFQQVQEFWQNQSLTRKITLVTLLASALIVIIVFIAWSSQPSYSVLYSGLSEADAGEIVQALQDQSIPYKLRNSSTILVPSDQVYEVRLSMAREGLPGSSSVGFEVFNTNSLIMTEFTQQVNYQRALEGELERTIGSLDAIENVRVHIVTPEKTLLTEDQQLTTASVTLSEKKGKSLDANQVRAITYLISSSVEGLNPEDVVIVDAEGKLLAGGATDGNMALVTETDSHRSAELAAATEIEDKVKTMLDTVLGPNRSVVKANIIMDWTQRETTSQIFEPDQNILRSEQTVDETYTTSGETGGIPGSDTNLPEEATVISDTGQLLDYARNEETKNYEITEVQQHEIVSPGQIQQVSLSVMVDGVDDEEQLATLRAAVIAAAGIDEENRGDVLSVKSMMFDHTYEDTQTAEEQLDTRTQLYFKIAEIAIPVIVILAMLFFLWRLFKNLRLASSEAWTPIMRPVMEAALAAPTVGMDTQPLISPGSTIHMPVIEEQLEPVEELPEEIETHIELPPLPEIKKPKITPEEEQLQRVLTRLAEESPATVAEIIQLWLNEDES